jgi:hypothetical protein
VFTSHVADPNHFNADPDPVFHCNSDPDPAFHCNADQVPPDHFSADPYPDPAPHNNDKNLQH